MVSQGTTTATGRSIEDVDSSDAALSPQTIVGCPDARPPAYQAVVGLAREGMLRRFLTSFYYGGDEGVLQLARVIAPQRVQGWEPLLKRRHHPEIPRELVRSHPVVDMAMAAENRLGARSPSARHRVARWRAVHFDHCLANAVKRYAPGALLVFSDVGSEIALPLCRSLGVPTVLSMVHGEVREEQALLADEARLAPDYFPLYLGDAPIDREEMAWLHERRLRDIALADLILVPSQHIANKLRENGTPADRIRIIPYAADVERFAPDPAKTFSADSCTFLFAGGICQRKGIKYLLEAWRKVKAKHAGWRLQLLGPLPQRLGPLAEHLEHVEPLGRVSHSRMPDKMSAADVFVFPSLFEGSAVVTYEALACGLPAIVTPNAGSVARDGVEGRIVTARDVDGLVAAMEELGANPKLRQEMAVNARRRALEFDWPKYHRAVNGAIREAAALRRASLAAG